MAHLRSVLEVPRVTNIVVWLTLVKLMRAHIASNGVLVVVHMMVLVVVLLRILVVVRVMMLVVVLGIVLRGLVWPGRKLLSVSRRHALSRVLMAMVALVLTVQFLPGTNSVKGKVGEAPANLCHNAPSACRVPDATIALSIRSAWCSGEEMGPHRLHQADCLGMGRNRQGTLHDIVPEGIHHQFANAICIAKLCHVLLFDTICAAFQALLHHIGAKLLNSQDINPSDNAFANSMHIFVRTDVENILYNVVSVCILHQLQRLIHDAKDEMRTGLARWRIETTLNHTATVTVTSNVTDTLGYSIKDKL